MRARSHFTRQLLAYTVNAPVVDANKRSDAPVDVRVNVISLLIMSCVFLSLDAHETWSNWRACAPKYSGEEVAYLWLINVLFFGSTLPLLIRSFKKPREDIYYGVLLCWYLRLSMQAFKPWGVTCEKRIEIFEAHRDECESEAAGLESNLRNMNCTPLGHSRVQILMTWILFSPGFIPKSSQMWFNIAFIVGLVCPTNVYYRYGVEHRYSWRDEILTTCLLFLVCTVAMQKKYYLEKSEQSALAYHMSDREVTRNLYNILKVMVPPHLVGPMLVHPGSVIADQVECASVLFIMIVDFDEHARRLSPSDLLAFLNKNFTRWDTICAQYGVTKIETVGEEYVCAVGVVPEDVSRSKNEGHASVLGALCLVASDILGLGSEAVQFRMGMHTGPLVAGVIGQKLPRFRLFGDTINTAARMMQKGKPGQCQFGDETKRRLPSWVEAYPQGQVEMKGKGLVTTYFLGVDRVEGLRKSRFFTCKDIFSVDAAHTSASSHPQSPYRFRTATDPGGMRFSRGSYLSAGLSTAEEEDEVRFGAVLRAIAKAQDRQQMFWRKVGSLGLRTNFFSGPVELEFYRWYHETVILKKLGTRLHKQALVLLVLTFVELAYFGIADVYCEQGPDSSTTDWRLPMYGTTRLACIGLIYFWQKMVDDNVWIARNPVMVQRLLALTYSLLAFLVFISYNFIASEDHSGIPSFRNMTRDQIEDALKDHKRGSSIYSLLFLPVYFLITTSVRFCFKNRLIFVVLSLVLMQMTHLDYFRNMFWSNTGRLLFVSCNIFYSVLSLLHEMTSRKRFKAHYTMESSNRRIHSILTTLMPPKVVEQIRNMGNDAPSHFYPAACIAQSDLVGFTKLASTRAPTEVVSLVSDLFGLFDQHTDNYGVYKVETIGDAYIAGQAGVPLTAENSPTAVVRFGLAMVAVTQAWSRVNNLGVNCRVGVHLGECVGGIVGTEMQRYHLFGHFMTVLEVLESTAPEGAVQVSVACAEVVRRQFRDKLIDSIDFDLIPIQGERLVTSKGDEHHFDDVGGRPFIARRTLPRPSRGG